jgi:hypothetical protein
MGTMTKKKWNGPLVGVVALGCALAGCAMQKEIRRSAIVPAVTPPMSTGQPIDNGLVNLSLSNTTYLRSQQPMEAPQSNAGLYIPRSQWGLQALFRLGRDFGLGPKLEIGMNQGAEPIADDIAPKPEDAVVSFGPAFQYSLPLHKHFKLGFQLETLLAFAPYNEFTTTGSGESVESGVESTLILGMALIPSFRWGPVVAFAGIAGRNQPTNTKAEIKSGEDIFEDDNQVSFGPMYLVTFGGLQLRIFKRLELTTEIYYPISKDPVDYGGPALMVGLGVALGPIWKPRPPRPRYAPPPPPYPYHRTPTHAPPPALAPTPPPPPPPEPTPAPPPPEEPDGPVDIQ